MSNLSEIKYDLFISYGDSDRPWVDGFLKHALGSPSVSIITPQDFEPGAALIGEIERAVTTSRYTLLVLSPDYLANEWGTFGEQLVSHLTVKDRQNRIIPLITRPCELPLHIDFRVRLDCTKREQWESEVGRIRELLDFPKPKIKKINCPYPGMSAFQLTGEHPFYGRETEARDLIEQLRLHPFLAIIGASGSGKSSLAFAGLVPALRKSSKFGEGDWHVVSLRPGEAPLLNLRECLSDDLSNPSKIVDNLLQVARKRGQVNANRLLLIVDQFEEVFTAAKDDVEEFQKALILLAEVPACYVVLTVRADFYGDLMEKSPIWNNIKSHRYELARMGPDALREAIVRPAKELGVWMQTALVERLLADAGDEPGILPFLQETLIELWERLDRRYLPLSAYESMVTDSGLDFRSGLEVAMSRRADHALNLLRDERKQVIARRILIRLVQFGEGRSDTRRQQSVAELRTVCDDQKLFNETLEHLTRSDIRLLTATGEANEAIEQKKIDISHEALLIGWPSLKEWIKERRNAEQIRRRLEKKVEEWNRLGQKSGGLLSSIELQEVEEWLKTPDSDQLGYDINLEQLVKASRRKLWIQRGLLAAIPMLVIAILGVFWWNSSSTAKLNMEFANKEKNLRLATQAINLLDDNFDQGLLLAAHAYKMRPVIETKDALLKAIAHRTYFGGFLRPHSTGASRIAFNPKGKTLATGNSDGSITIWTIENHQIEFTLKSTSKSVRGLQYSPDGQFLAAIHEDETIFVWKLGNDKPEYQFKAGYSGSLSLDFAYGSAGFAKGPVPLLFTADSKGVVYVSADMKAVVFDLQKGVVTKTLNSGEDMLNDKGYLAFSSIEQYIAAVNNEAIFIWNLRTPDRQPKRITISNVANFQDVKFLTRDKLVVITGEGKLLILDSNSGISLFEEKAHAVSAHHVTVSSNGEFIATAGNEKGFSMSEEKGVVKLWKLNTLYKPNLHCTLELSGTHPFSIDLNEDGSMLATTTENSAAELWTPQQPFPFLKTIIDGSNRRFTKNIQIDAFKSHNSVLLLNEQGEINEITTQGSLRSLKLLTKLNISGRKFNGIAVSPDGTILVLRTSNQIIVVDNRTTKVVHALDVEPSTMLGGPLLIRKNMVVSIGSISSYRSKQRRSGACIWNLNSNQPSMRWLDPPYGWGLTRFAATSNGMDLLTGSTYRGLVTWWNLRSVAEPRRILFSHDVEVNGLVFSPMNDYIYSSHAKGMILRTKWGNIHEENPRIEVFQENIGGKYPRIAISPDGEILAVGSQKEKDIGEDRKRSFLEKDEGELSFWSTEGHTRIGPKINAKLAPFRQMVYTPDGSVLITTHSDGSVMRWDMNEQIWASTCNLLAGRPLTDSERQQFGLESGKSSAAQLPVHKEGQKSSREPEDNNCFFGFMEMEFRPLQCSKHLRELISHIIEDTPQDENILQSYAAVIEESPLLLSGDQVNWALSEIKMRRRGTAAAIVLLGLTGEKRILQELEEVSKLNHLTTDEKKSLTWATKFLKTRGRSTSLESFSQLLQSNKLRYFDFLSWPKGLEHFVNWQNIDPSKKDVSWPKLKSLKAAINKEHLAPIAYYYFRTNRGPANVLALCGELIVKSDPDEALDFYNAALKINPNDSFVHTLIGLMYTQLGKTNQAIEFYKKSLALGRNDGWPEYNLGKSFEKKGDYLTAEKYYQLALQDTKEYRNKREHAQFLNEYAWFIVSHYKEDQERLHKALSLSEQSNKMTSSKEANYLDTLAAVQFALGRVQEAIEIQKKAIQYCDKNNIELKEILEKRLLEYQKAESSSKKNH